MVTYFAAWNKTDSDERRRLLEIATSEPGALEQTALQLSRPLLARLRTEMGVDPDPVEAFRRGGYAERLAGDRGTASVESAYERA